MKQRNMHGIWAIDYNRSNEYEFSSIAMKIQLDLLVIVEEQQNDKKATTTNGREKNGKSSENIGVS